MDAFAWGVIGSVATVVAAVAAIIPIAQNRRKARRNSADESGSVVFRGGRGVQVGTANTPPAGFEPAHTAPEDMCGAVTETS